jgi:hypothetical protein
MATVDPPRVQTPRRSGSRRGGDDAEFAELGERVFDAGTITVHVRNAQRRERDLVGEAVTGGEVERVLKADARFEVAAGEEQSAGA